MRKSTLSSIRNIINASTSIKILSVENVNTDIIDLVKDELGYKKDIVSKEDFINDISSAMYISMEKYKKSTIVKGDPRIFILGEDLIGSHTENDYEKIYNLDKTLNEMKLLSTKDFDKELKEKLSGLEDNIKKHFGKDYDESFNYTKKEYPSYCTFYKDKEKAITFLESKIVKTIADVLKAKYVYRSLSNSDSYYFFMASTNEVYDIVIDQTHDNEQFMVLKPTWSIPEALVEYTLLSYYTFKDSKHKIKY